MVSKSTADRVAKIIREWCVDNEIDSDRLRELFHELKEVQGNSSFRTSIALINDILNKDSE